MTGRCSSVTLPRSNTVRELKHFPQLEQVLVILSRLDKGKIATRLEHATVEMCTSSASISLNDGSRVLISAF